MRLRTRIARLKERMLSKAELNVRSMTDDELLAMLFDLADQSSTDHKLPVSTDTIIACFEERGRAADQVRG